MAISKHPNLNGLSEDIKRPSNAVGKFAEYISRNVNSVIDGMVGKISKTTAEFLHKPVEKAATIGTWAGIAGLAIGTITAPGLSYATISALAHGLGYFKVGTVAGGVLGAVQNVLDPKSYQNKENIK